MKRKINQVWLLLAAIFGFLGVASGAFGAHILKSKLPSDLLTIFETGSRYCLIHAVILTIVAFELQKHHHTWLRRSAWGFSIGITIFSGSLWILALSNTRWLGAITPLGGLGLLFGWLCIFFHAWNYKPSNSHWDHNE